MTGMTTNAIDLFEGLRLCEGVSPVLMVGKPDNIEVVGSNRFYSKYLSDSDVVFYKSCVSSPFQVLKTTIRVIELLVQGRYDWYIVSLRTTLTYHGCAARNSCRQCTLRIFTRNCISNEEAIAFQ